MTSWPMSVLKKLWNNCNEESWWHALCWMKGEFKQTRLIWSCRVTYHSAIRVLEVQKQVECNEGNILVREQLHRVCDGMKFLQEFRASDTSYMRW